MGNKTDMNKILFFCQIETGLIMQRKWKRNVTEKNSGNIFLRRPSLIFFISRSLSFLLTTETSKKLLVDLCKKY